MSKMCERKNDVINDTESTPEKASEDPASNEIQEDVVVIQEEEMVLVRKESPVHSPVPPPVEETLPVEEVPPVEEAPEPKCIEPEPTMSAPPSKSKPKKKQHKRK
jgi:hypothetical protein